MDFLRSKDRSNSGNPMRPVRSPTRKATPSPPSRIVSPSKVSATSVSLPSSTESTPSKKWRWFHSSFFKSSLTRRGRKYSPNMYEYNNLILTKFIPLSGCLSYAAFAFYVYQPKGLFSFVATQDVPILANCLLFNSHLGIGLYLYSRSHMSYSNRSNLCITKRIIYSIYGSVLFNFGSILLWATTSSIIPTKSVLARTFFAISSSLALLLIGHEYMSFIDYRCKDKSSLDASDEEDEVDDESDIHYQNFN